MAGILEQTAGSAGEVSLVGRREQLDELTQALTRALDYESPQVVTLVGSPGVGKSRLLRDFLSQVRAERPEVRVLAARAQPGEPDYGPVSRLLRERFDLEGVDAPEPALRAQLEQVLGDKRVSEIMFFLGFFIGVEVPDSPFLRAFETQGQQGGVARTVLARFLELDAESSPLVLVLEDLHRADALTISLFCELAESLEGCPLLLVGSLEPEALARHPELQELDAEHTRLDLPVMSPEESAELLGALLGTRELPASLVEMATDRARGNPLFMEQLVGILLEKGLVRLADGRAEVDEEALPSVELPLSVEEALQARVAMLSPAERDVLEKAAVVGESFWVEALLCLSRLQQEVEQPATLWMADVLNQTIREILAELVRRDHLVRRDQPSVLGATELAFRHESERQVLLALIPEQRRRRYHLFTAQWLETRLPVRSEAQLRSLGEQYAAGGNRRKAAFCHIHAGDKARARYANEQALQHYQRGLQLLDLEDLLSKMEAVGSLGEVCALLGRHQEAVEHYSKMLHCAWLLDHREKGAEAHRRLGRLHSTLGDYGRAMTHLNLAIRLFEAVADSSGVAGTLDDVGRVAWLKGEYQSALEFHRRALEIQRDEGSRRGVADSLDSIGRVHRDSGSLQAAEECFHEAMDIRREEGDRLGVVRSLGNLGELHRAQSQYGRACELWLEALELARELGARLDEAYLLIDTGEAQLQLGQPHEAERYLSEAAELARDLGDRRMDADAARVGSQVKLALGDLAAAAQLAERAHEISLELGLKPELGLALRALAEVVVAGELGEAERARASELFSRAIDIFSELGNDLELARTFAGFARFHERLGQWEDADHFRSSADDIFGRMK